MLCYVHRDRAADLGRVNVFAEFELLVFSTVLQLW